MVAVEMTVFSLLSAAHFAAGRRYARDFPVPVPASMTATPPSLNRRTTADSISRCPGRSSYPSKA